MIHRIVVLAGLAFTDPVFGVTPYVAPQLTLQHGMKQTAGPCVTNAQCIGIIEDQCGPGKYSLFDFWLETTNGTKPMMLYSQAYECVSKKAK